MNGEESRLDLIGRTTSVNLLSSYTKHVKKTVDAVLDQTISIYIDRLNNTGVSCIAQAPLAPLVQDLVTNVFYLQILCVELP